ncbi:50S ribosomal L9 C-terminal domain-containing protein, partial [Candidatus Margulisiibacteriota bacterium]
VNLEAIAKIVNGKTLEFTGKIHDENKLYGSVTDADIVDKFKNIYEVEIDKKKLVMPEKQDHIKIIGDYVIKVNFHPEIECAINVKVAPETEKAEKAEKAKKE